MWGVEMQGRTVEESKLGRGVHGLGQDARLDVVELLGGLLEGAVHRL